MTVALDMVGITTKDLPESLRFYRALGLEIKEPAEGEAHVETTSGGMRIAWDTVELIKGMLGEWEEPKGNRMELAFKCDSADEVDRVFRHVVSGGFQMFREPWDAFLGAAVRDPRGPRRQSREFVCLEITGRLISTIAAFRSFRD